MNQCVDCPECGARQTDLWDYEWGTREELTASCGSCGADYLLSREVAVDYYAHSLRATHQPPPTSQTPDDDKDQ